MKRKLTLIAAVLFLAGCTFNVKPIYNDKGQAKAETAVTQFHKWHNDRKRVSRLEWSGGGCFNSRRRVNSTVRFHNFPRSEDEKCIPWCGA